MIRLLILADDFTGALDTGVQFAVSGAATLVETKCDIDCCTIGNDIDVLVLDMETRHLAPKEAYELVARAVKNAKNAGIPYIYKKTDSALRGNIGAELAAVYDMAEEKRIHFIPAFPRMKRITRGGIHYIDGVPVGESVFGKDPFEPVTASSVAEIIGKQSQVPVQTVGNIEEEDVRKEGIIVYDVETEEELNAVAQKLLAGNELGFCAGCAGFAAVLPELLGLKGTKKMLPELVPRLLIACGSMNPITISQLDYAEKAGIPRIRLNEEQKLSGDWLTSREARSHIERWKDLCIERHACILDSNGRPGEDQTGEYIRKGKIDLKQARQSIASNIGGIVKELLDEGLEATLMITGGDTLKGFMERVGITRLRPIYEAMPGTVVSGFSYRGKPYHVISKSGGFGCENLIVSLLNGIPDREDRKKQKAC